MATLLTPPPLLARLLSERPEILSDLESIIGPVFMDIDHHEGMGYIPRPSMKDGPFPCLEVLEGPEAGRKFRLCAAEETRLGRGWVRIELAGREIRDVVAHVTVAGDEARIEDCGAPVD
jgi:hypothetical protein